MDRGPVGAIRHACWEFGFHPRGNDVEWAESFPFELAIFRPTYDAALAAAGDELRMDRAIAEAVRELWPLPHRAQP